MDEQASKNSTETDAAEAEDVRDLEDARGPIYLPEQIAAALSRHSLRPAYTSCLACIAPYLRYDNIKARAFVLRAMQAVANQEAFCRFHQRKLDTIPAPADTYGLRFEPEILKSFGFKKHKGRTATTWFLKFCLEETADGQGVCAISMHCLKKRMRFLDGTSLSPEWSE